jgi:hypothetical protein
VVRVHAGTAATAPAEVESWEERAEDPAPVGEPAARPAENGVATSIQAQGVVDVPDNLQSSAVADVKADSAEAWAAGEVGNNAVAAQVDEEEADFDANITWCVAQSCSVHSLFLHVVSWGHSTLSSETWQSISIELEFPPCLRDVQKVLDTC